MALVILVRHGQTDENISGRISGQGPVPLNTRGQEQARLAAEVLAPLGVTHIVSSPIVRALQTAEILAERLQQPIQTQADLREVGYGDWEGKTFGEMRGHPVAHLVFNDPIKAVFPNGESLLEVQQRGVQVIEWVRETHPQGIVAVVSHGDVIRTALAHYLGMPFNEYRRLNLDNGAISVLELFNDWVRVKALNFVPQVGHLWLESFYPTWKKMQALVASPGPAASS
ncbi:MAG: histidine phosphatase family protein [Candidatus Tectimicrobiota bacterium]